MYFEVVTLKPVALSPYVKGLGVGSPWRLWMCDPRCSDCSCGVTLKSMDM